MRIHPVARVVLVAAAALGCGTKADRAPHADRPAAPAPLGDADFAVASLAEGADSGAVRRALGAPDSVLVEDNPFDPGAKLVTWRYRDALVGYTDEGRVSALTLTTAAVATARGLRVGDAAARVRALYGAPADSAGGDWEYPDPREPDGGHVMRVRIVSGRVASIFVGTVLD